MWSWIRRLWAAPSSPTEDNTPAMKYLIACLGNIGTEYDGTRHNVGFEVADMLAHQAGTSFSHLRYGFVTEIRLKGKIFIVLKPNTFMNLSGKAVQYWMQQEKIPLEQVLVVTDDLNLDFGKVRLKPKGSAGGHNGLKHIEEVLKTDQYARLRIGIGNAFSKGKQVDFVLGKWSAQEHTQLLPIVEHCAEACRSFGLAGLDLTMNQFNKQIPPPSK